MRRARCQPSSFREPFASTDASPALRMMTAEPTIETSVETLLLADQSADLQAHA